MKMAFLVAITLARRVGELHDLMDGPLYTVFFKNKVYLQPHLRFSQRWYHLSISASQCTYLHSARSHICRLTTWSSINTFASHCGVVQDSRDNARVEQVVLQSWPVLLTLCVGDLARWNWGGTGSRSVLYTCMQWCVSAGGTQATQWVLLRGKVSNGYVLGRQAPRLDWTCATCPEQHLLNRLVTVFFQIPALNKIFWSTWLFAPKVEEEEYSLVNLVILWQLSWTIFVIYSCIAISVSCIIFYSRFLSLMAYTVGDLLKCRCLAW